MSPQARQSQRSSSSDSTRSRLLSSAGFLSPAQGETADDVSADRPVVEGSKRRECLVGSKQDAPVGDIVDEVEHVALADLVKATVAQVRQNFAIEQRLAFARGRGAKVRADVPAQIVGKYGTE